MPKTSVLSTPGRGRHGSPGHPFPGHGMHLANGHFTGDAPLFQTCLWVCPASLEVNSVDLKINKDARRVEAGFQ